MSTDKSNVTSKSALITRIDFLYFSKGTWGSATGQVDLCRTLISFPETAVSFCSFFFSSSIRNWVRQPATDNRSILLNLAWYCFYPELLTSKPLLIPISLLSFPSFFRSFFLFYFRFENSCNEKSGKLVINWHFFFSCSSEVFSKLPVASLSTVESGDKLKFIGHGALHLITIWN